MDEETIAELLTRSQECQECHGKGEIGEMHGFEPGGVDPEDSRTECSKCQGSGYIIDSVITDLLIKHGIRGKEMGEIAEAIYEHYRSKLMDAYKRGTKEAVIKELEARQEPQEGQEDAGEQ